MRKHYLLLAVLIVFAITLSGCFGRAPDQTVLHPSVAQRALEIALLQIDKPYVFGARGPDEFDCSGLIVWSYKQAYPDLKLRIGNRLVEDANINEIYKYNVEPVLIDNLIGGDIVFITDSESRITHGALFIRHIDSGNIEIVHASSFRGKVAVESWPIDQKVRDQWFVGAGRLMTAY